MAWLSRGGRSGVKACLLRLSQPSGQVTTTSSNWKVSPDAVVRFTLLGDPVAFRDSESILTIGRLKRISARWRAF